MVFYTVQYRTRSYFQILYTKLSSCSPSLTIQQRWIFNSNRLDTLNQQSKMFEELNLLIYINLNYNKNIAYLLNVGFYSKEQAKLKRTIFRNSCYQRASPPLFRSKITIFIRFFYDPFLLSSLSLSVLNVIINILSLFLHVF